MFQFPDIDPVAFALGPLQVHWYGLMYVLGFVVGWFGLRARSKRADSPVAPARVEDLVFYMAVGVFVGGRVGYMLIYDFGALVDDPLSLFYVWRGGMSFHGGLIGVLLMLAWFARRTGQTFFALTDFAAPWVTPDARGTVTPDRTPHGGASVNPLTSTITWAGASAWTHRRPAASRRTVARFATD